MSNQEDPDRPSEREKFEQDRRFRAEEIALKRQELQLKSIEINQRKVQNRVILFTIIAGVVSVLATLSGVIITADNSRVMQERGVEADRILQVLKDDNRQRRVDDFNFLVRSGLVSQRTLGAESLNKIISTEGSGQVPISPDDGQSVSSNLFKSGTFYCTIAHLATLQSVKENLVELFKAEPFRLAVEASDNKAEGAVLLTSTTAIRPSETLPNHKEVLDLIASIQENVTKEAIVVSGTLRVDVDQGGQDRLLNSPQSYESPLRALFVDKLSSALSTKVHCAG